MINLERTKNGHNYNVYTITTNEGKFSISFEGNLDLYWSYHSKDYDTKEKIFNITKENMFIYNLFEKLYKAIKTNKPYSNSMYNWDLKNKSEKLSPYLDKEHRLFIDNKIVWHSDTSTYEESPILTIEKTNNSFKITFTKGKDKDRFHTLYTDINFCNNGSRYIPFQASFMNMYQELDTYNYDYHQIHIDEYLEEQKSLKKKIR